MNTLEKNKYIAYHIDGDILLLSIKEVLINKSILLLPNSENDEYSDGGPFFLATMIPAEIIGILCEDRLARARFKNKEDKEKIKELNEKTGYFIENNTLKFRQYYIKNNKPDGEDFIYKEEVIEQQLVIVVDENGNSELFMEFESDDCARLYVESTKNDWENEYGGF